MRLTTARLCIECEEIYEGRVCPHCASDIGCHIAHWIHPMREAVKVVGTLRRAMQAVDDPEQWVEELR